MNSQSWQTVVSLGAVALAAAWWSRHVWRTWASPSASSPCGGCSGCPNNTAQSSDAAVNGFVPLTSLEAAASQSINPVQPDSR